MAYLNFTDALMESKRRARLQGREVTQQEAAGISEGVAKSAGDRSVQIEQLAQNKQQYETSMAQREKEFGKSFGLQEKTFAAKIEQDRRQYDMAVRTLSEQIRQYEASSAAQKAQFGEQMRFQISESAKLAAQWKKEFEEQERRFGITTGQNTRDYDYAKAINASAMNQGGVPLPPSIYAPTGWNAANYLKRYPGVAAHPFYKANPLNHYVIYGKNEGRNPR